MRTMDAMTRTKAEIAKAHRERFLEMVRAGKMSVDDYLTKVCGVPMHRLPEMRALAGL